MEFVLVAALVLVFGIWSRRQFGAQQERINALETSVEALSDQLQRLYRKVSSQAPGAVSPVEPSEAKQASMPEAIVEPPAEATGEEEAVHLPSTQDESEIDPVELYKASLEPGGQADADRAISEADAEDQGPAAAAEAPQGDEEETGPEPAGDQPAEAAPEPVRAEETTDQQIPQQAARRAGQTSFEQRLSTNWLVWIGGVALALAGVFLVRYIAEQGWLSPATRCFLGGIFGVALIVAGEFIRRRPLQRAIAAIRPDYVPQALSSAGLVTVFGSVYLAYAFYDLIPPSWSFAALGSIAIAAFGLSLVEGAFVALIGLLGAALTPALISTDNPSPWGFFSYLGVIALTSVAVADRKKWHWLPELAILSYAGWGIVWTAQIFRDGDVLPIGLTSGIVALAALAMALRSTPRLGPWKQQGRLSAISAATVAWTGLAVAALSAAALALLTNFSAEAHWVVLAFAISAVAIARYAPAFGQAAPVMAVLSLLVFTLSYVDAIALDNLAEKTFGWPAPTLYFIENYQRFSLHGALISLVFYFGGVAALSRQKSPQAVAIFSGFLPLALTIVGYAQFRNYSGDLVWVFAAALIVLVATATSAYLIRSRPQDRMAHNIYATLAVLAAIAAATFLLDRIWLTLGYSAIVLVVAAIATRADLIALRRLVNLIVFVVLVRLTINPDLRGYEIFHPFGLQWVTYGYLVPLACFLAARHLFKRVRDDMTVTVLEGAALLLAVVFVSIEIRIFMTGTIYSGAYNLPEISLQSIAWLTSALILAYRNLKYPRLFSKWGARLLTIAGGAQAIGLQLVLKNPVFTGDFIDGYGIFNLLILSLLAPSVLLWLIARVLLGREDQIGELGRVPLGILRALSTLLAFAFVTEEVRVVFQGMLIAPYDLSLLELYSTTTIWLLFAAIPYALSASKAPRHTRTMALYVALFSALAVVLVHVLFDNPVLIGEQIRGWPVFNVLLLGFFVPAAVLYFIAARVEGRARVVLAAASYVAVFVGLALIVKHAFQGARLLPLHANLLELYITTVVWILLGSLPYAVKWVGSMIGARVAGLAVLSVSLFTLFAGHALTFNPVLDGSFVRGTIILNELLVGFIVPAALIALVARKMPSRSRRFFEVAAYVLTFIGVTMLVKQAFQGGLMTLEPLSNSEDYAYSAAWLVFAVATMFVGLVTQSAKARNAGLVVLLLVVLKVFLLDMSSLSGLWRIASFFGLGISLIAIGWVYQHFVFAGPARAQATTDSSPE